MSVDGTIVVEFGTGVESDALVVVELDDEANVHGYGEVKTSFVPGDEPEFLVHYDTSVLRITRVACSAGMIVDLGQVTRVRTRQVSFVNQDDTQELPHIPAGPVNWKWYGNAPQVSQDGPTLMAVGPLPAIGDAEYPIAAQAYRLIPPVMDLGEDEQHPVLIVVYMEKT